MTRGARGPVQGFISQNLADFFQSDIQDFIDLICTIELKQFKTIFRFIITL